MKVSAKINDINHDDLVNLFSTALYGSDYFYAHYDKEVYESIPEEKKEGDCFEDKLADMLLNGHAITIGDVVAEGEHYGKLPYQIDEEDESCEYTLTIEDVVNGMGNPNAFEYVNELFVTENGDYWTATNLLQVILFGEEIYG